MLPIIFTLPVILLQPTFALDSLEFIKDEFGMKVILENYAQYLPRGKRQLKLNVKELTDAVLARDLIAAPLTKTSGLNRGGLLSLTTQKPKNPKSQSEYIATIKNKNNLERNPNFTGFKNDFKI